MTKKESAQIVNALIDWFRSQDITAKDAILVMLDLISLMVKIKPQLKAEIEAEL